MKINRLNAKGFIGFKKGMGVDEINIDFAGLSGLIALTGRNGAGKSSCMELLSPYRILPSRPGALRNHVFLRDSFKDLEFEYEGNSYKTLVKVDAESDRTEGFIWKNGESQVNGKITAYDDYITKLLGSSNLFYNSVFCAQNATKLSDMRTGQLKELFVEFLRLDRLAAYESSAKQCVVSLGGMTRQSEQNIKSLKEQLEKFSDIENKIADQENQREVFTTELNKITAEIELYQTRIKELEEAQATNKINIERRDEIQQEIDAKTREHLDRFDGHFDDLGEIQRAITEKMKSLHELENVLKEKDAVLNASKKVKDLEKDIADTRKNYEELCRTIEALYTDDRQKGETVQELRSELMELVNDIKLKELDEKVDNIRNEMAAAQDKIDELTRKQEETEVSFEVMGINSEIKACKDAMKLLDQRDPSCKSETCSFIVSALQAEKKIPDLKEKKRLLVEKITKDVNEIQCQISRHKESYETNFIKLGVATKEYQALRDENEKKIFLIKSKIEVNEIEQKNIREHIAKDLNVQRDKASAKLNTLETELVLTKKLSEKVKDIERAEWSESLLNNEINSLMQQTERKKAEYSNADIEHRAAIRKLEKRLEEVSALINENAPKQIEDTKKFLSGKQKAKEIVDVKIVSLGQSIAMLESKLSEKADIEKKISAAHADLDRITKESSQWVYLQNACGKNGLQALEIDGVAPLVTGYGNDLLTSSFGPGFTVRIITQDPETGKETFDIIVIRSDGSEVSFKKLSGGEKVWILKAIRLGMTLVSKEKSGRNFETLLADEEDGPLDSEKAQSFIGLYKSILEVGGFNSCFYISHNPEVVSMADHRIEFTGNGIEVN
jgi:exonuclease SbcC